jgi:hypothetical protein
MERKRGWKGLATGERALNGVVTCYMWRQGQKINDAILALDK